VVREGHIPLMFTARHTMSQSETAAPIARAIATVAGTLARTNTMQNGH
jgi:hypothetical protein